MLIHRFEAQGRHSTNFHYYYLLRKRVSPNVAEMGGRGGVIFWDVPLTVLMYFVVSPQWSTEEAEINAPSLEKTQR